TIIPILLHANRRKFLYRMSARVFGPNLRHVLDPIARIYRPAAEIHIFEPNRMEALIEPVQTLPDVATDHQEGARRLFHGTPSAQIPIQVSIGLVDRITWEQPVETQQLEYHGRRRRQATDGKSNLG